jgi:hypothetical protein
MRNESPISGWARASLWMAVTGLVCIGSCTLSFQSTGGSGALIGIVGCVLGICAVFAGIVALFRIPDAGQGRRYALIGIILGLVETLPLILLAVLLKDGWTSGRPFRARNGQARRARTGRSAGWSDDALAPQVEKLATDERQKAALTWRADAEAEHASIAAFARLQLELLAVGAPSQLVERVARAGLDEVEHARACFSLACALAGEQIGPGPFPEATAPRPLPHRTDEALLRLAIESLIDGALNEGLAAACAREAAARASDAAVRSVLTRVAEDEAEHARLGWDICVWAATVPGSDCAVALRRALHTAVEQSSRGGSANKTAAEEPAGWTGRVPPERVITLRQEILSELLERVEALTSRLALSPGTLAA